MTATPDEMPFIPAFRLSAQEGKLAIQFSEDGPWRIAQATPSDETASTEDVQDWLKLVPAFLVSAMADKAYADLEKVKTMVDELGPIHAQVVNEVKDKLDVSDRKLAIYRQLATELLNQPIAGPYYRDWLEQAFDNADLDWDEEKSES